MLHVTLPSPAYVVAGKNIRYVFCVTNH